MCCVEAGSANGRLMTSRQTKAVLIGVAGASLGLLLSGFVVFAAIATRSASVVPASIPRADAIVALTGGEARIREAARLLDAGKGGRLLISGVNRRTSREDLLRLTNLSAQKFDCCVDVGYEALDTYGNADEARVWASQHQFRSLIIVTASYHMPRSLAEIGIAMPGVRLVAYPVVPRRLQATPWWLHLGATRALIAEYLRFLPVATRLVAARIQGMREPSDADRVTSILSNRS
jgi:uncharacterized SAM-binding protein YcdF (DUF218 family)